VAGVHGLKGVLKVGKATAPEIFLAVGEVDIGGVRFRVVGAAAKKRQVLLHLQGVNTREQAELLMGQEVRAESRRLPPLPEGEYYVFQLEGLSVRHAEDGTDLGELTEIIPTPAHDVYVVAKDGREVLFPAVEEVVVHIDLDQGVIKVLPPPGLIETYAD
jgi:16S rRNA processing protein RimM